jgi:outer membrane murein-binding lipoprotein Lpp
MPIDQERIVVLDSLKPESLSALCEQLSTQVAQLESEFEQASRQLETTDDAERRREVEREQATRNREIELLRARLETYCSAQYHEDDDTMRKRTLRVA